MRQFYVYILSSATGTLYVGVTNDLDYRVAQHKSREIPGFTARYRCDRLMWFQTFPTAIQAIKGEKQIKGWTRKKKVALVKEMNPEWIDLSLDE